MLRRKFISGMIGCAGGTMAYRIAGAAAVPCPPMVSIDGSQVASPACGVAGSQGSLLAASDFQYLGYYDVPAYGSDNSNGMTIRYVGTDCRLLVHNSLDSSLPAEVLEYSLTGKSFGGSTGSPLKSYQLGAKIFYKGNSGASWQGIYWDQQSSRLYVTSSEDYDTSVRSGVLTYYQISGTSITSAYGPVGLQGVPRKRIDGGFLELPASFQSRWSVPRLAVGLGGYSSAYLQSNASLGPALYAIPDISQYAEGSDIPTSQFKTLLSKPVTSSRLERGQRIWRGYTFNQTGTLSVAGRTVGTGTITGEGPLDYMEGGDPRPNGTQDEPNFLPMGDWGPLSGNTARTAWTWNDRVVGAFMLDGPAKRGYVAVSRLSTGKVWYEGGSVMEQGSAFELAIYDPQHLGEVSAGQRTSSSVQPVTLVDLPQIDGGRIGSAAFDSVASRLYVRAGLSNGNSRVYVYSVSA